MRCWRKDSCDPEKTVRSYSRAIFGERKKRRFETARGSPPWHSDDDRRSGAITGPDRLGAIGCVDADVLRGKVAGPTASASIACMKVHDHRNVVGKELVAGGTLVEV